MEGKAVPVKPKRRYDSSRRRKQALRAHETILEAAKQLFLRGGYAGTTITSIAEAADVSVETIYKRFGGKPALVRAIWEKGLEGAGPIPAEQRSDEMRTLEWIRTGSCSVGACSSPRSPPWSYPCFS